MNKLIRNEVLKVLAWRWYEEMEALLNMEFTAFVGLAFVLYAIRRATNISKKYLPVIAVFLGVAFASFEAQGFNFDILMTGLKYALYSVGIVMGAKFAQLEVNARRQKGNKQDETTTNKKSIEDPFKTNDQTKENEPKKKKNLTNTTQTENRPNVNHKY
jgi:hypothetical protein